jgi:hypothetical protein
MSQVERASFDDALRRLSVEERAWLDEQIVEYADLLVYLHDH